MQNDFYSRLNYPDPFKPTGIEFELPEDALVTITIFDSRGQQVKTMMTGERYSAGHHTFAVNLDGFAKENYFYKITATSGKNEYSETKRLV